MINYLPPKQRNQNLLSNFRNFFLNISFKDLLDKETNLLNKLPDLDNKLEDKVANFLIIFTIFLTTFTVVIGFYSSSYSQSPADGSYNVSKAKNFLFLNSNSLAKIKEDTQFLSEYESAYNLVQNSDSKIFTLLTNIYTEFSKGGEIKGVSIKRSPQGYEYSFRLIPEGRDFLTFIESIKTYYPELEDIKYQDSNEEQLGTIIVSGNIRF